MRSDLDYLEHPDFQGDVPNGDGPPEDGPPVRRGPQWNFVQWLSIALTAIMVIGALSAYGVYLNTLGGIDHEELDPGKRVRPPETLNGSVNILILGSDTRAGDNSRYGTTEGERSDTTILLHLSAGGKKAIGISFPRDSWVNIPECRTKGKTIPARQDMLNSAFTYGGANCTWNTIESLTNIRIDHFVKIDFTGFKNIVNALGGVEICSPKAFSDPKSELVIRKAGRQQVNGETALGWVRTRYKLGDGTDLGRIQRQQQFMSAVAQKATTKGVLTNPNKLRKLLGATTDSLTTDREFGPNVMLKLAGQLKGMTTGGIKFVTVPWRYATIEERKANPAVAGRVFWQPISAGRLFDAIRKDNDPPKRVRPVAPAGQTTKVDPAAVKVKVFNGTATEGLAGRAIEDLKDKKYLAALGATGTFKDGTLTKTVIQYGPGGQPAAQSVAALVPGAQLAPAPTASAARGTVYLYLGKDYTGLAGGQASLPKVEGEIKANADICKPTA